ncbi:hypothetical protein D3C84_935790 [compost metagenome]
MILQVRDRNDRSRPVPEPPLGLRYLLCDGWVSDGFSHFLIGQDIHIEARELLIDELICRCNPLRQAVHFAHNRCRHPQPARVIRHFLLLNSLQLLLHRLLHDGICIHRNRTEQCGTYKKTDQQIELEPAVIAHFSNDHGHYGHNITCFCRPWTG